MATASTLPTYWLARKAGGTAEGPFGLGQIRRMYEAGTITGQALVCQHGTQDWFGIEEELEFQSPAGPARAAPLPVPTSSQKKQTFVGTFFSMVGGAGLLVLIFAALGAASPGSREIDLQVSGQQWARHHLADKDAEIMGFGPIISEGQDQFRVMRVRGKNRFGGPVINDFIATLGAGGKVIWAENAKDFRLVKKSQMGEAKARVLFARLGINDDNF